MARYKATVTSKGQITIPVELRRDLGIVTSDKVIFEVDDQGFIEFRREDFDIDSLFGIVPALTGRESVDYDEMIAEAQLAGIERMIAGDDTE